MAINTFSFPRWFLCIYSMCGISMAFQWCFNYSVFSYKIWIIHMTENRRPEKKTEQSLQLCNFDFPSEQITPGTLATCHLSFQPAIRVKTSSTFHLSSTSWRMLNIFLLDGDKSSCAVRRLHAIWFYIKYIFVLTLGSPDKTSAPSLQRFRVSRTNTVMHNSLVALCVRSHWRVPMRSEMFPERMIITVPGHCDFVILNSGSV